MNKTENPERYKEATPIKNDVLQALLNSPLSCAELKVALFVYRKTIGWNKKSDLISLSQFERNTALSRRAISYALESLKVVQILSLLQKGGKHNLASKWAFNENVNSWQVGNRIAVVQKRTQGSAKTRNKVGNRIAPTKRTLTKRTIQNEREVAFLNFYSAYPTKKAKQKAKEAWEKVNLANYEQIMKTLELQKQSEEWKKERGKYIPFPASWLNGRRWEDETKTLPTKKQLEVARDQAVRAKTFPQLCQKIEDDGLLNHVEKIYPFLFRDIQNFKQLN